MLESESKPSIVGAQPVLPGGCSDFVTNSKKEAERQEQLWKNAASRRRLPRKEQRKLHPDSDGKKNKRPYITPTITKLPPEQANRFIVERTLARSGSRGFAGVTTPEQQPEKQPAQSSANDGKVEAVA